MHHHQSIKHTTRENNLRATKQISAHLRRKLQHKTIYTSQPLLPSPTPRPTLIIESRESPTLSAIAEQEQTSTTTKFHSLPVFGATSSAEEKTSDQHTATATTLTGIFQYQGPSRGSLRRWYDFQHGSTSIALPQQLYQHSSTNITLPAQLYQHNYTRIALPAQPYQYSSTNINPPPQLYQYSSYQYNSINITLLAQLYQYSSINIALPT